MSTATTTDAVYPRLSASLKPLLLLIGVAAAVAAGVTVVLWSRGPNYSLLYANLATEDQAQITQALDAAQIPYKVEPGSSGIMVPSERLNDARMKLAGQGLPEGDGGFALMTKDPGLGVSQFIENARYQHALETELAHTIASLRPVDGARVHIAAPRQSAFVRDNRPGSASVFVQLKPGRRLAQEQVQAIVNLVASSIPDLESSQVTVVDQQGHLLTAPQGSDDSSIREERFQLVRRMEDDYEQRVEAIVTPVVGTGRVRAQVVADVDTAVTEQAHEEYKPDSQIVRSEQSSEQVTRDGAGTQGVPGALTNQPPGSGVAQAAAPVKAVASSAPGLAATQPLTQAAADAAVTATADNVSKSSTKNYEIDRTVAYSKQPAGRLKRLTVAVVVDNMRALDKSGKPKDRPLTDAELAHITALVKDAVGFDEARGDSVNVVNATFQTDAPPPETELEQVPIWETPMFQNFAKLGAGLIVMLVLALAVLRPLIKGLISPSVAVAAGVPALTADATPQETAAEVQSAAQAGTLAYEQQVTDARTLVKQDPKRVAQVVRTWVTTDG
jgi:flagellar M-ring protein FliF